MHVGMFKMLKKIKKQKKKEEIDPKYFTFSEPDYDRKRRFTWHHIHFATLT